ncbi:hypothetical protein BS78_09G249100 [Paspalum vaginatum]|nr:hypothetical protein BS78_09G249100 [Paspalum vaginatum]
MGMERHELVQQLRFPPGYRFVPTEEQLIDVYLRCKIEGDPLHLDVVNEVSILDWTPDGLVETFKGYGENKWYFFTIRDQSSSKKEKQPSRKVKAPGVTASWKATGSAVPIMKTNKAATSVIVKDDGEKPGGSGDNDENNKAVVEEEIEPVLIGLKRVLTYQSTDPEQNGKWSMHEYILQDHDQIGQYSLCSIQRILHSNRRKKKNGDAADIDDQEKSSSTEEPSSSSEEPGTDQTTLAETPLKPTTGKTSAQDQTTSKGKGEPPMQAEGVQALQQQQQLSAAYGAPAPLLPVDAVPLQVLPSYYPGGGIAARASSKPMHGEGGDILSQLQQVLEQQNCNPMFLQHNIMSQFLASEYYPNNPTMAFNNQQEQPSPCSLTDGVQNQPSFSGENDGEQSLGQYGVDQFLVGNTSTTTQLMNTGGWEHDGVQYQQHLNSQHYYGELSGHQIYYQQDDGGVFGVQDQDQQRNYGCYDGQYFKDLSLQVDLFAHAGSSPDEQFIDGSEADYDSDEAFAESVKRQQDDPEDSGSDDLTSSSQSQDEQLRCSSGGLLEDVVQCHMGWHDTGI